MGERKMYNFPFVEDGQTYWRSRSCTTVGYVFCADKDGYLCVLANQRGPGAPTNVGKWNVPCGYIGFIEECGDVDGNHAIVRETYEETGVKLNPSDMVFDSVSFSTTDEENINLRYICAIVDKKCEDFILTDKYSEPNEVSAIRWIRLENISDFNWAFGHEKTIIEMSEKIKKYFS